MMPIEYEMKNQIKKHLYFAYPLFLRNWPKIIAQYSTSIK